MHHPSAVTKVPGSDGASRSAARTPGCRALSALFVAVALGGCSWFPWFAKRPPAAASTPASPRPTGASPSVDVRPAVEAQAACPNHAKAFEQSSFPRGAIIRGVDSGRATVRFAVDGDTVTILSVASSDPEFGNEAMAIVRRYVCHTERPTTFEVPFDWRTGR